MASLNSVQLIGNICKDLETRPVGQSSVTNTSIAVNEKYKDKNGQQQENTEFLNLVFWSKQGELAERLLQKGSGVFIQGKLKTESWEKDGVKQFKTTIVVSNFQLLTKGKGQGAQDRQQGEAHNQQGNDNSFGNIPAYEENMPF